MNEFQAVRVLKIVDAAYDALIHKNFFDFKKVVQELLPEAFLPGEKKDL